MNKINHLLAVLTVGLLAAPMVAQAQYDYQLIDHPGGTFTQVFGINDRGDVVGNGFADPISLPFVYDSKKGGFTDVAAAAGYADTGVLGISDAGVMVGSVLSLDLSTESGFIRGKDGTFTVFSHPDAVFSTNPRGVNNKGLVSGFRDSADNPTLPVIGFIYDPKSESFTDFVPSLFTLAHGINSKGDVVGNAVFFNEDDPCPGSPDDFVWYGWLRKADGSVSYFQVNGVDTQTRARGINDAGWIVGAVNDAEKVKGFKVKLDGSPCQSLTVDSSDLLEFPGFDFTFPEGITNSGKIVGIVADSTSHGFIATPQKGSKKK